MNTDITTTDTELAALQARIAEAQHTITEAQTQMVALQQAAQEKLKAERQTLILQLPLQLGLGSIQEVIGFLSDQYPTVMPRVAPKAANKGTPSRRTWKVGRHLSVAGLKELERDLKSELPPKVVVQKFGITRATFYNQKNNLKKRGHLVAA